MTVLPRAVTAQHVTRAREAGGARWYAQLLLFLALAGCIWLLSQNARTPSLRLLLASDLPLWLPFSTLIFWRWGWALAHWCRAGIYAAIVYPRLRRAARAAAVARGPVREVAVLLATYKERADITARVIASVLDELARTPGLERPPLIVAVTGCNADDATIREVFAQHALGCRPELILLRGADGKRDALAKGLEVLRAWQTDPDGVFVMMDGDTELGSGALSELTPLFRLEPKVAAVTTNEHAVVHAPAWFCEWIHLRHGQRHLFNCSIALSGRLLCLTGRYSVFRAAVLDSDFIEIVRNDRVDHWLWGQYRLLSGDDKSTWFHLLSRAARLLYVPDQLVITHETVGRAAGLRAYHNLRRWGGNMVRNSERAIRVGPRKLGWFCCACLIDQRLIMWTTLVGPTAALYTASAGRWDLVASYLLWVIVSRSFRCLPIWLHGRRISVCYAPLAVLSDWASAVVKIWVTFFPARQYWLNRGSRELDSTRSRARHRERLVVAWSFLLASAIGYVVWVGYWVEVFIARRDFAWLVTGVRLRPELALLMAASSVSAATLLWLRLRVFADDSRGVS